MIGDKRFIEKIKINNILSFGPDSEEIELKSLNVLVGPNSSGKSNFIEIIGLLRSTASDITKQIASGGGVAEWLWKGSENEVSGKISTKMSYEETHIKGIVHGFSFNNLRGRFNLKSEYILHSIKLEKRPEYFIKYALRDEKAVYFQYKGFENSFTSLSEDIKNPVPHAITLYESIDEILKVREFIKLSDDYYDEEYPKKYEKLKKLFKSATLEKLENYNQSIVSQRKGPDYPVITYLNNSYSSIKIYNNITTNKNSPIRGGQLTDLPEDFLLEDASNFNMVMNDLKHRHTKVMKRILELLKDFNNSFYEIDTQLYGGRAALYLRESIGKADAPIPATRLSDGTLSFLCLLVILCHPEPPPLICIEEPEIGLHPDMLPIIADLLIDASHRTQLIVTTHSDILVDALTKTPEAVIVCEKHEGSTTMRRLDEKKLKLWLKKYSLGELWRKGEIGGNRW